MTWLPGTMANGSGRIIMSDNICKYIGHIYIYIFTIQYNTLHYNYTFYTFTIAFTCTFTFTSHYMTLHYITFTLHTHARKHTHTYIHTITYIHTYIYIYIYLFIYLYTSRLCDWISPHIMPRKGLTWTDSRLCNNLWLLVTEWHLANSALEW